MRIFVASTSEHKLNAVKKGFQGVFPKQAFNVQGYKVASEINEQPVGSEETIRGALNRLNNLKKAVRGIKFMALVAFENGIFSVKINGQDRWFDIAWIVLEDASGKQYFAHSLGIELPLSSVQEAFQIGVSTTTAGSMIARKETSDPADPHSFLTSHTISRSEILEESLQNALGQLLKMNQNIINQ